MKFFTFLLFFSVVMSTQAASTEGLTDDEKAQVEVMIENIRLKRNGANPERIKNYADIGKAVAESLGAAAKELGVAVNDFAETDIGKITVYIIVWKLIGIEVLRIAICVPLLFMGIFIWIYFYRRIGLVKIVEDTEAKTKTTFFDTSSGDNIGLHKILMTIFLILWVATLLFSSFAAR